MTFSVETALKCKTDKIKMVTPIEFVVETEGENDDGDK